MTILGIGSILADIPRPVRSRITMRLSEILATLATVRIGMRAGYAEEAPVIYLTPGRESIEPAYGFNAKTSEYTIILTVDQRDYEIDDYEIVDRLIASVEQAIAIPDQQLDDLIERKTLTGTRPGYREDQGNLIGAELTYQIVYAADPADPDHAI